MLKTTIAVACLFVTALFNQQAASAETIKDRLQIAAKSSGIEWQTDVRLALQKAAQENKMVFIDIGADW